MNAPGTVLLVDDDAEVRHSLQCVMTAAGWPSRAFATAEEFLQAYQPAPPACLVLDLRMPGMGGQKLLETLRQRHVALPVIVISAHADVPAVIQSMKLGLVDFLTKPLDPQVLVNRVTEALRQDAAFHAQSADRAAIRARIHTLTDRQRDVLRLLMAGKLHKEIARELGISVRTVDHHHEQINVRTKSNNIADLVRMGLLAGLE